jgi:hypothetical protein
LLAAVRLSLKTVGFARTIRAVRQIAARAPLRSDTDPAELPCAARAVAGRAICLEQALALYFALRRRGFPVELRIGIQPYPFFAHAWVEHLGQPVNEDPEVVRHFVTFPEPTP